MTDINLNEINIQLNDLNNMDININTNKKQIQIGERLEEMKSKIISEIQSFVTEIEEKNVKTDEYKTEVRQKISKITDKISELIERINRYNGLVDREKSDKRLRDLLDEKLNERETAESKYATSIENLEKTIQETKSSIPEDLQDKLGKIESKASIKNLDELNTQINTLQTSLNQKADQKVVNAELKKMDDKITTIDKKYNDDILYLQNKINDLYDQITVGKNIVSTIKNDVKKNKNNISKLNERLNKLEELAEKFKEIMKNYSKSIKTIQQQNIPINYTLIQQNLQINIFDSGFIDRFMEMLRRMYQEQDVDTSKFESILSQLTNTTNEFSQAIVEYKSNASNKQQEQPLNQIENVMGQTLNYFNNLENLTTQHQPQSEPLLLKGPQETKFLQTQLTDINPSSRSEFPNSLVEFPNSKELEVVEWQSGVKEGNSKYPNPTPTLQETTPAPPTTQLDNQELVDDINTLINGLNPFLKIYNELRKLEEFVQIERGIEGGSNNDWWKQIGSLKEPTNTIDMDSILKFMENNEDCNNFEKLSDSDCKSNKEISTPGVKSLISQLKQDNHNLKKIKNGIINTKDIDGLVKSLKTTTLQTYYFKRLVYDIINPEGNATFESNKEKLLYNLGATFDEKIEIRKKGIFDYLKKNYKMINRNDEVIDNDFEARFNEETIKNQIMKGYKIPENSDCSKITEKNTISLLTCLIITIDRNWDGKISVAEMKAANLDNIMKGLGENGPVSQEKFIDFFLENTTGVNAPKNGLRLRSNKSLTEEQAAKLEDKPSQTNIIPSGIVPELVRQFNPLNQKEAAPAEKVEKAEIAETEATKLKEVAITICNNVKENNKENINILGEKWDLCDTQITNTDNIVKYNGKTLRSSDDNNVIIIKGNNNEQDFKEYLENYIKILVNNIKNLNQKDINDVRNINKQMELRNVNSMLNNVIKEEFERLNKQAVDICSEVVLEKQLANNFCVDNIKILLQEKKIFRKTEPAGVYYSTHLLNFSKEEKYPSGVKLQIEENKFIDFKNFLEEKADKKKQDEDENAKEAADYLLMEEQDKKAKASRSSSRKQKQQKQKQKQQKQKQKKQQKEAEAAAAEERAEAEKAAKEAEAAAAKRKAEAEAAAKKKSSRRKRRKRKSRSRKSSRSKK